MTLFDSDGEEDAQGLRKTMSKVLPSARTENGSELA